MCHLVLGVTIGIAPLGGWVAVTGEVSIAAFCLFIAVLFWLAGFDTVYATQDANYDRDHKLHSIPSRFGIKRALQIAKGFHLVSFLFFCNANIRIATELGIHNWRNFGRYDYGLSTFDCESGRLI